MPLDKLFPTPVFYTDLPEVAVELINFQFQGAKPYIEQHLSNSTWGDNISTTFSDDIAKKNAIEFYELHGVQQFTEPVVKYFNDLLYKDSNIALAESWINYQRKHQHQRQHTHTGYRISAVYYVNSNGEDGSLTFHPPASNMEIADPSGVEYNYSMISYPAKTGRLFVFPSWVPHSVSDNLTDSERISIAMNFG